MSIDALTTVADFREAPDQCSPGDQQRLRIHVPKVSTTLSMGAKAPPGSIRDLDAGAPNYDGFGVFTLGHIHLSASDTPSTSTSRPTRSHLSSDRCKRSWIGLHSSRPAVNSGRIA